MIIIKCPWARCIYCKEGLCSSKYGVIELRMVDDDSDGDYLECTSSRWIAEEDNIDDYCE